MLANNCKNNKKRGERHTQERDARLRTLHHGAGIIVIYIFALLSGPERISGTLRSLPTWTDE